MEYASPQGLQMFGERWDRILSKRGAQAALYLPDGSALTFRQLDAEARHSPPRADRPILAQGDPPAILRALLRGFLHSVPVQLIEKDRALHVSAVPPPAGTALIKQTVGGSGVRRCQFFTFEQIAADVDRLHGALDLDARGVGMAVISCAHSFGLTMTVLQTLLHGVPVCSEPQPFAQPLMEALRQHRRVFLPGVPALWKSWLAGGVDFSNVGFAISAGSPLTLALERQALERKLKIHNLYGTSECGAVSWDASDDLRSDERDLGALLPGVTAQTGKDGRLIVFSSSVGLGYDRLLAHESYGSGCFATSDVIHMESGRLIFERCAGEGINVAGRKLSPQEIASKIQRAIAAPGLKICGVPSRDPERCQDIAAMLEMPQAAINAEFKAKACALLAPWEVPRKWSGR